MRKLWIALLMACCSSLAHGQTTNQAPTIEITYQMSDDGYAYVPLPFTFPFYNRKFTDSWMYDNGIVSFLPPWQQSSVQPWQWWAVPLNEANGSYFIAPLWADMAPVSITKYFTQTDDSSYMKYTWQDLSEYYSQWGTWRLNTFSTTIKKDGSIQTHYTNVNLETSVISVGTVGNISSGEYSQLYYYPCCTSVTNGMISDWSVGVKEQPSAIIESTPIYLASDVSSDNIVDTIPLSTIESSATELNIITTSSPPTTSTAVLVQAATEFSPWSITTASIITDSSSSKMSSSDVQSIAKVNQKNVAELITMIVNASSESSVSQNSSASNDLITVNDGTSVIPIQQSAAETSTSQLNSGEIQETGTIRGAALSATSLAYFSKLPGTTNTTESENVQNFPVKVDTDIPQTSNIIQTVNTENTQLIADETNPTSVRRLAAIATSLKQTQMEEEQEKKNQELASLTNVDASELALAGVKLTEFQVLPFGYSSYLSLILRDNFFYPDREIYRNQTVIDNAPAQRLMQFTSDAKFEKMINQQYGEK